MPLQTGKIFRDRYLIIEMLGQGLWGRTYLAEDRDRHNEQCVIKEIEPISQRISRLKQQQLRIKFNREFQALQDLEEHFLPRTQSSPNLSIPRYIDHFEVEGRFYIVQEFIKGIVLSEKLKPGEPLVLNEVRNLIYNILEVLRNVHDARLVHRDIKPDNIILRNGDICDVVLIDFGTVREVYSLARVSENTYVSQPVGAPPYIAPERLLEENRGRAQIHKHPRIDIYSVGIIGKQALTGLTPDYALANPLEGFDPQLEIILNKMVERDYTRRYQSAFEILDDLTRPPETSIISKILKVLSKFQFRLIAEIVLVLLVFLLIIYQTEVFLFTRKSTTNTSPISPIPNIQINLKDPKKLIELNNQLIEYSAIPAYTIALVVPETNGERNADAMYRGVAQLQTSINLELLRNTKLSNNEIIINFLDQFRFLKGQSIQGKGLKVLLHDDENNPDTAVKIAKELTIEKDRLNLFAIVGHYASKTTLKTVDIYENAEIPLISPGSTAYEITHNKNRKYFLRTVPNVFDQAKAIKSHLKTHPNNFKKVLILYSKTDFPISYKKMLEKFIIADQKLELEEGFSNNNDSLLDSNNFDTTRIIKNIPEDTAIVLIPDGDVTPNAKKNAIKLLKEDKGKHHIVGAWTMQEDTVRKLDEMKNNQKMRDNFVVVTPWFRSNDNFNSDACKLWEGPVNALAALTYDASLTIVTALNTLTNKEISRKSITEFSEIWKDQIFRDKEIQGATDKIYYKENGDRDYTFITDIPIIKLKSDQNKNVDFVPIDHDSSNTSQTSFCSNYE